MGLPWDVETGENGQGGVFLEDLAACESDGDEMQLLAFYSACDGCDFMMHHSSVYTIMDDGRTLCGNCKPDQELEDIKRMPREQLMLELPSIIEEMKQEQQEWLAGVMKLRNVDSDDEGEPNEEMD
jgi:hypothetical protein